MGQRNADNFFFSNSFTSPSSLILQILSISQNQTVLTFPPLKEEAPSVDGAGGGEAVEAFVKYSVFMRLEDDAATNDFREKLLKLRYFLGRPRVNLLNK